jgi:hypothetical protein
MKKTFLLGATLALLFVLSISNSFAQGKGGGRPSNPGNGGGMGRPTTSPGVDRGINTSSTRSNGRSDDGFGTASTNSNGRSDAGLDRARLMRDNSRQADREIRDNPGFQNLTHMNANDLRAGYQSALLLNPELKFGQYVAANMIARNFGTRYPNVTAAAILNGINNGDSIGETLRDLGVGKDEAKRAEKEAKRQMKEARN